MKKIFLFIILFIVLKVDASQNIDFKFKSLFSDNAPSNIIGLTSPDNYLLGPFANYSASDEIYLIEQKNLSIKIQKKQFIPNRINI